MNWVRSHHIRDNLLFALVAMAAFLTEPALVHAQDETYDFINFTQPLPMTRGTLNPASSQSAYMDHAESCRFLKESSGWDDASCAAIENIVFAHIPGLASVIVRKPNSEGYVKFDDWDAKESDKEIEAIWQSFVDSTKEQSKALGYPIEPIKWVVYPTLLKDQAIMYYAISMRWDGEMVVNIEATKFDRAGYVSMLLVPDAVDDSEAQLAGLVTSALDSYKPKTAQTYFDFKDGDKVAAAGALGVLATLVGVKYGKALFGGLLVVVLALAKKLWFVVLLPFVWLFRKLFRSKD